MHGTIQTESCLRRLACFHGTSRAVSTPPPFNVSTLIHVLLAHGLLQRDLSAPTEPNTFVPQNHDLLDVYLCVSRLRFENLMVSPIDKVNIWSISNDGPYVDCSFASNLPVFTQTLHQADN